MTIDDITEKIIESRNNDIAKAFTLHISSLLLHNGIEPIMTEYTENDVENIEDTDEYKIVMEYGIAFKELDCTEHDKEIYNKAIDDFVNKINESNQGHWRPTRYEHGEVVSETMSYDIGTIRLIAKQLRAGEQNE